MLYFAYMTPKCEPRPEHESHEPYYYNIESTSLESREQVGSQSRWNGIYAPHLPERCWGELVG